MDHARDWIGKNIATGTTRTTGTAKKTQTAGLPESVSFAIDIGGNVVGSVGFHNMKDNEGELGYWLAEKQWGKGLMTEAVEAAVSFAFRELGLRRIYANVFVGNEGSRRVLEKAGFTYKGITKGCHEKDGKKIDVHEFELIQ